jgi:hypothetical protein
MDLTMLGVGFLCLLWTLLMIDCRHDTMQVSNTTHHGRVPRLILPGTFTVDVTVDVTDRCVSPVCALCALWGLFVEALYALCVLL